MNIKGLTDFKKEEKKDAKKPKNSYVGGESSGMAVEHPDDIEAIVEKAKLGGREHASEGKGGAPKTELKITLYSNGFIVGENGPFRQYDAPENKQFMKELNEGYVPQEIRGQYKEGVSVGLEDRRKEEFTPPPPPKYVAYSGSGVTMGGVQGQGLSVDKSAGGLPPVDDSKPKTIIQIRFHNGEKASVTMNLDRRVADLH